MEQRKMEQRKKIKNMIAFDCSNTSVRAILGRFDGERLDIQTLLQEENAAVRLRDYEYWDVAAIYQKMLKGLAAAVKETEAIDSIGICTWGVDFAFFTKEGIMLGNPLCYRNPLGAEMAGRLSEAEERELFRETGLLCDKINSLFMLQGIGKYAPSLLRAADKLLMIPDIFNYLFTGVMSNEPSEFSTSQLMHVGSRKPSPRACREGGISSSMLSPIGIHGTRIGNLLPSIREELGIDYEIPVICVPSHDTAAAVLAIPAEEKDFAFISSGTWALIGTELEEPLMDTSVMERHLTNELGAFDRITLLKNNAGQFIIQRLRQEYDSSLSWDQFYQLMDASDEDVPLFDVNDNRFFNPSRMGEALWNSFLQTGQVKGAYDIGKSIKSFLLSMALSYRDTVAELEQVCQKDFVRLYIVGGGVRNRRLCQLAADYTGKTVITGSSESTSYGNLLAQLKYFEPERTVESCRKLIGRSVKTVRYESREPDERVLLRYQNILNQSISGGRKK